MATSNSLPLGEAFQPYAATAGEDYMSDPQLEHFRQLLLLWQRNLLEEAGRTLNHMKDATTVHPDPNDRATQEEEFSLALRTRDRERKLLSKISQALTRIDAQDYGYCKSCGEAIGLRRLEARPTATLCIDCKTAEEVREKQAGL